MHNAEISFDLIFPCLACYVNNITQKAEPFSVLLNQFSRSKEKSTSKHLYCKKKKKKPLLTTGKNHSALMMHLR